jgi:adenylosuccinate synthase
MVDRVVLLSGPISSGKSTLARGLEEQYGMYVFRTKEVLARNVVQALEKDRLALQAEGDRLDKETDGRWVVTEFVDWLNSKERISVAVIDSVRTLDQVAAIRDAFGARVTHIHLTAPPEELELRFNQRRLLHTDKDYEYSVVKKNATEQQVETLASSADIVVNTQRCTASDVLTRTTSHPRIWSGRGRGYVDVVIGGQYGSEGKGQIVDYLSGEYDLLIRVGGPNAGHSVFHDDGTYIHHQLPSGTLKSHAKLLIGPGAVLRVPKLLEEIAECHVEADRLTIDGHAAVITDADIEAEKGLVACIGSTGQGVGSATARRIMKGREEGMTLVKNVPALKPYVGEAQEVLKKSFSRGDRILLEGTQGTGLSLYHGNYPHVTSRDTTVMGCLSEAGIAPNRVRRIVMVCRTYPIRVQNPENKTSGPLREMTYEELSKRSGISVEELTHNEKTSTTRKQRRLGEFEWDLLRRASLLNGPTDIALTFADYIRKENRNAMRFEQLTEATISLVLEVERVAGAPVSLIATGFNRRSVIDRRTW